MVAVVFMAWEQVHPSGDPGSQVFLPWTEDEKDLWPQLRQLK